MFRLIYISYNKYFFLKLSLYLYFKCTYVKKHWTQFIYTCIFFPDVLNVSYPGTPG